MYLEQLYLRGFKTFADPTTLEFDRGITAIVGPNGVGKSNIVDAILWALGEQSPRALRTTSLQEVIFAGTEERRALGMAEVTVTLDNSDGALPTDYSEVAITRRLFRNGQSEYLINRNPSRLRDVRDLLLDTGLGPQAYSVIGQGQIDAILSVQPEDRRELLEEAAGVRKYRVRRDEAERRLERTKRELRRLRDIIAELTAHVEPLEEEAEKALRFRDLDARLRQLELQLLASEYLSRRRRRGRLENDRAVAQENLAAARRRLHETEKDLAATRQELIEARSRADELQREVVELDRQVQEVRRKRDVAHHQRQALEQQIEAFTQSRTEAERRRNALQDRCHALEKETLVVEEELEQAASELATAQDELTALEQQALELERQREEREALLADLAAKLSRAEQEAAGLESLEAELEERLARLGEQLAQMHQRREQLQARQTELEAELARHRRQREELAQAVDAAAADYQARRQALEEHEARLREVRENLAATEARLETLTQLAHSAESVGEAAAAVTEAAAAGELPEGLVLVADVLEIEEGFEQAIATVLGERARWIVAPNRAAAEAVAKFVRERGLGRVGVLVLDELTPRQVSLPHAEEVIGPAARYVAAPSHLRPLLDYLLGGAVIVETLQAAERLVKEAGPGLTAVTREGHAVSGPGELVLGGAAAKQSPALHQAQQRRRAQAERDELAAAEAGLLAAEEELRRELAEAAAALEDARANLARQEQALQKTETELAGLGDSVRAAAQALTELRQDIEALQRRRQGTQAQRVQALETAAALRRELEELKSQPVTSGAEDLARQVAAARERVTAAQIRCAQLEQRLKASQKEHERTLAELQAVEQQVAGLQERLETLVARLAELDELLQSLPEVEPLEQRLAAVQAQAEEERQRSGQLVQAGQDLEQTLQELRAETERLGMKVHQADLALAREEAHLADLAERLQDQFSVKPDQIEHVLEEGFTRTQAEKEAEDLREQMRALGPVNPGAPEELERLKSRKEYLETQREDVSRARDELLELIEELDQAAREEFLKAFEEVGEAFAGTYRRLFGGGETRLELTNPEDPLQGGVDIIVRPPGKKLQNMMLLSGGEKALTALAFIFALLAVRPSPFCVLDEIDAALDASSTDRFLELLDDFAQRSQFIVVTHNPQTIAAAKRLYGVTMQTPGISLVLQVELEEAQELAREGQPRPQLRVAPAS
ncbi:MAG: chromosome segregation protein SMC [Armatimonadetes bacterium]|nr:chromosome segregation protein SMC [Armatimonadota bacterium]